MEDTIEHANQLFIKANKKLNGFSFFGDKYEDALELFEKSLNKYKILKSYKNVANVALIMSSIYIKLKNTYEAAASYIEAYKAYKNIITLSDENFELTKNYLEKAIELFKNIGNFNMVSKYYKELAELHEVNYIKEAIEYYTKAIDFYNLENNSINSDICRQKMAILYTQVGDYNVAANIYEDISKNFINNNSLKYQVKSLLMNAEICRMVNFCHKQMFEKLNEYKNIDVTFETSREYNFLFNLIKSITSYNLNDFSLAVFNYNDMTKLDDWKLNALLTIKNNIQIAELNELDDEENLM